MLMAEEVATRPWRSDDACAACLRIGNASVKAVGVSKNGRAWFLVGKIAAGVKDLFTVMHLATTQRMAKCITGKRCFAGLQGNTASRFCPPRPAACLDASLPLHTCAWVRVEGLGFWVWGFGFGVWGLGFRV